MIDEIRCVIHFLYLNGTSLPSAHAQLVSAYGEGCISRSGIRYWYNEFRSGRTSVETMDRPGRPPDNERMNDIKELLDNMPNASARYISSELKLDRSVVTRILKVELGLQKRHFRWVPHDLSSEQKMKRVELAKSMLKTLMQLSPSQRAAVVTGDESWFFLTYSHDSKWCAPGEKLPDISKRLIQEEKVMIFVSFNCQGLVYMDALPTNSKFNSTYMAQHIMEELTSNANSIIKKFTKHSKILHIDNARPHTAKQTKQKILDLGWKQLEQPPYSPDISPCDSFLFGFIKEKLKSYKCTSVYELVCAIREIIEKIEQNIWEKVYSSWLHRLEAVIDCDGDYPYIY